MAISLKATATFLMLLLSAAALPAGQAHAESVKFKRTVENYKIPDVVLINQDGKKVRLAALLTGDQPVVLDFIFATCTTICPVLSAGFVNLQRKVAAGGQTPRMVSITIDPDNDNPKVMKEYLKRFRARPGWDFLTGSRSDIETVLRSFNAYQPVKMSHSPLNLIRDPKDGSWVRLFGIMSSREFLTEYQRVAGK